MLQGQGPVKEGLGPVLRLGPRERRKTARQRYFAGRSPAFRAPDQ